MLQTAKLKSPPNKPLIRYFLVILWFVVICNDVVPSIETHLVQNSVQASCLQTTSMRYSGHCIFQLLHNLPYVASYLAYFSEFKIQKFEFADHHYWFCILFSLQNIYDTWLAIYGLTDIPPPTLPPGKSRMFIINCPKPFESQPLVEQHCSGNCAGQ